MILFASTSPRSDGKSLSGQLPTYHIATVFATRFLIRTFRCFLSLMVCLTFFHGQRHRPTGATDTRYMWSGGLFQNVSVSNGPFLFCSKRPTSDWKSLSLASWCSNFWRAARYTMQEARDERLIMFFSPSKRAMRPNGTWESSRRPVTSSSSPVSSSRHRKTHNSERNLVLRHWLP